MKMELVLAERRKKTSKGLDPLILKTFASLLSVFITENGLYKNWENETYLFHYRDWKGRVSRHLPPVTVQDILDNFLSSQRERSFSLFYQMDYKKTYIGKNFLPEGQDLYLKFYRLDEPRLKSG